MPTDAVFKLARRKRLTDKERAQILLATDAVNNGGMNLIHYMIVHVEAFDAAFFDQMLASGHALDNFAPRKRAYSAIQSVLSNISALPQCVWTAVTRAKIEWLIHNHCPFTKSGDKSEFTRFMLYGAMTYSRDAINAEVVASDFILLLKQMLEQGHMVADDDSYYMHGVMCRDVETLEWLDNTFAMDWSTHHGRDALCESLESSEDYGVIQWLLAKNPALLQDSLNMRFYSILEMCTSERYANCAFMKRIFAECNVSEQHEHAVWAQFTDAYQHLVRGAYPEMDAIYDWAKENRLATMLDVCMIGKHANHGFVKRIYDECVVSEQVDSEAWRKFRLAYLTMRRGANSEMDAIYQWGLARATST